MVAILTSICLIFYCILEGVKRDRKRSMELNKVMLHYNVCIIKTICIISVTSLCLINRFWVKDIVVLSGSTSSGILFYIILTALIAASICDVFYAKKHRNDLPVQESTEDTHNTTINTETIKGEVQQYEKNNDEIRD